MKASTLFAGIVVLLIAAIAAAPPAPAHDMSAMSDVPGAASAGQMGQMGSHMNMGAHMVMTQSRPATTEDIERAKYIVDTLRRSIRRYRNYKTALANYYVPFLPSVPQDVYHFTSYRDSGQEYAGRFDPTRPGSLLYVKKGPDDYRLVGAMYSAPPEDSPEDLNALIPLSVGTWHAHINICLPEGITLDDLVHGNFGGAGPFMPGMVPVGENPHATDLNRQLGVFADGRFGFEGKIAEPEQCKAAGGRFIKQAFGWMIHVYPFAGDDLKVAYSTDVPASDDAFAR